MKGFLVGFSRVKSLPSSAHHAGGGCPTWGVLQTQRVRFGGYVVKTEEKLILVFINS